MYICQEENKSCLSWKLRIGIGGKLFLFFNKYIRYALATVYKKSKGKYLFFQQGTFQI